MGKGDRKTKKGKRFRKSYGKSRPRKKSFNHKKKEMDKEKVVNNMDTLYLLRQGAEFALKNLTNNPKKMDKSVLSQQIKTHEITIQLIDDAIAKLRKDFFQFSVEELYSMYGQYDKFISIEFHEKSDSAIEFGESISGILIYNRREREDLNKILKQGEFSRTNTFVKIDLSKSDDLQNEQVEKLRNRGFLSGDVFKILVRNSPNIDSYRDSKKKEIPGTLNIKFEPDDSNPEILMLNLWKRIIARGDKPMIESEWDEYYTYKILYEKSEITEQEWTKKIYEPNSKTIKERIRINIIRSKLKRKMILSGEETQDFLAITRKRKLEREKLVKKELNRVRIAKLKALIDEHEEVIKELNDIAYYYEEENFSTYGAKYPVYLRLERYLHIFIGHFEKFQMGKWIGKKTPFQYNFKDTTRLIKIIIEQLQPQIDEALDSGKEFNIYDKRAFYYNGNYYSVHVGRNGELKAFYPHENL